MTWRCFPVKRNAAGQVLVRNVATVSTGTTFGEIDRYNMQRQVSITANIAGTDLGSVSRDISAALQLAGDPPRGVKVEIRGQIPPMREMLSGLAIGLGLAIVAIFLLLSANFQSLRLSLITVSTAPAAIAGMVLMLFLTHTTLNIQSFIGAIMAVGVAMANAILLVTFAENHRRRGEATPDAAVAGAAGRLRPILMTTCAMMGGMLPWRSPWASLGKRTLRWVERLSAAWWPPRSPLCLFFPRCLRLCSRREHGLGVPRSGRPSERQTTFLPMRNYKTNKTYGS